MIKILNKQKKNNFISLVEYWYLSLKKDIDFKKSDKLAFRKKGKKKKSNLKLKKIFSKILTKKKNNKLKIRVKLLDRNTNFNLVRSFRSWFLKKYNKKGRSWFLKRYDKKGKHFYYSFRWSKYFVIRKFKRFKKIYFFKKYKVPLNILKKQNKIKLLNRIVYLNLLYIFSKYIYLFYKFKKIYRKKRIQKLKLWKELKFTPIFSFLLFKKFKKFKKLNLNFLKNNRYLKWWYLLRLNYIKKNKFFKINKFFKKNLSIENKKYLFINKHFSLKKYFNKLKKENKNLFKIIKFKLFEIKNRKIVYFFYFWSILKIKLSILKNKIYLIYNFIIFLINLNINELILLYNYLKMNNLFYKFSKNKNLFILKKLKRFNKKKSSILRLRISKNKLIKIHYNIKNNLLLLKSKFKYYKNFKKDKKFKVNYNYLKYYKIMSYKSKIYKNKNNIINSLNEDYFDGYNLLFLQNNNNFYNKVNYYYSYLLNFFLEFRLQSKKFSDINAFIKNLIFFIKLNKMENKYILLLNIILLDRKTLKNLYKFYLNFGINFKFYLKWKIKKYLYKISKNSKGVFYKNIFNKIKSKSTWKRRINLIKSIKKNLFKFNFFYVKYFSLQLFMISEKINLMEGFIKMKNLYKKYKMVNPVRTLIVSDTEDRELFCFIWNVWEGYNFYKDLLMDLIKKSFTLNVKDFSINEWVMKNKKYKSSQVFYKTKKKINFAKGNFKVKMKKIWSRIIARKTFSFFNLLLFWYLKFYNKIFLLIKLVLFRLWVYYYFEFNKTNLSFSKIFKFKFKSFPWLDLLNFTIINKNYYNLLQQLKFKKQLILNCFNFNPFLQQIFFDYYRSKNLYNDYFFKSVFKSFVMHLGYLVSITKNKTWKDKEKTYNKVFFRYKYR